MNGVGRECYVGYKVVEPSQRPGGMEKGGKDTLYDVLQGPQRASEDGEPSVNSREL